MLRHGLPGRGEQHQRAAARHARQDLPADRRRLHGDHGARLPDVAPRDRGRGPVALLLYVRLEPPDTLVRRGRGPPRPPPALRRRRRLLTSVLRTGDRGFSGGVRVEPAIPRDPRARQVRDSDDDAVAGSPRDRTRRARAHGAEPVRCSPAGRLVRCALTHALANSSKVASTIANLKSLQPDERNELAHLPVRICSPPPPPPPSTALSVADAVALCSAMPPSPSRAPS